MELSSQEREGCEERRHDDLAAYALGALPGDEARELEAHLAGCAACSERLRWLEPAVDLMPASVEQLEPPPGLRQRLMAEVQSDLEASGAAAQRQAGAPERRGWLERLRGLAPMRPAMAGFAVVALLLAGVGGYVLAGGEDSTATYTALPESPGIEASGTVEVGDGQGTLLVEGLPALPDDQVYQAWIAQDGQASPSSIFVTDRSGSGSAAIPEIPDEADAILITTEPAGGSETPRTAPVLRADLD
jgi:anti-sigma-K factor RskA